MTVRDREVLEVLRDEPELLAIADAVGATGPRRRRRLAPALAAAAAVAALVLLLVSPWSESGGPSLAGRALAAIGHRPILHSVVRYQLPGQRVELSTGRSEPIVRTAEMWADEQKGLLLVESRADGGALSRRTARLAPDPGSPFGLAALYRQGLEDGKLRKTAEGVVHGRNVIWVASPVIRGIRLEAALDRETYDPVVMRYVRAGEVQMQMDVLEMDTVAEGSVRFGKPDENGGASGGSTSVGPIEPPPRADDVKSAQRALAHPVLWLGRAYRGLPLSSLTVESTMTESKSGSAQAEIVHLQYGNRELLPDVSVEEMNLRKERDYLTVLGDVIPPAGYLDLEGASTATVGNQEVPLWRGALRRDGLYITIEARSREQVLDVARALRPAAQ